MEFQVAASRLFLLALHENYDKLKNAGIDIKITFSTENATETGIDETDGTMFVKLKPDEKTMAAFMSLAPFAIVTYGLKTAGEITVRRCQSALPGVRAGQSGVPVLWP